MITSRAFLHNRGGTDGWAHCGAPSGMHACMHGCVGLSWAVGAAPADTHQRSVRTWAQPLMSGSHLGSSAGGRGEAGQPAVSVDPAADRAPRRPPTPTASFFYSIALQPQRTLNNDQGVGGEGLHGRGACAGARAASAVSGRGDVAASCGTRAVCNRAPHHPRKQLTMLVGVHLASKKRGQGRRRRLA